MSKKKSLKQDVSPLEIYEEPYYTIPEIIILNMFPLGRRTLENLVRNGARKLAGEEVEDYILAKNIGTPKKSAWRITETELLAWLDRRQKMATKKGLMRPEPPVTIV